MKNRILIIGLVIITGALLFFQLKNSSKSTIREKHASFLKNSPFKKTLNLSKKERKALGIPPNKYLEREWELTMNPDLGRPTPEKLFEIQKQLDKELEQTNLRSVPGEYNNFWEERGPNNVGGRTKALLFDPNDPTNETVFAGGVSGGLWKNTQISDPNSAWSLISVTENLSVTTITVDANDSNIFYLGTGESYTSRDSYGNGVWKSTDAGLSWTQVFGGISGPIEYQETNALLTVNSPASIMGNYDALQAAFGPDLTSVSGNLVLVDDGTFLSDEGCSPLVNGSSVNGNIALIKRGNCNFTDKVKNAQNEGAIAVIMINNVVGANPITMAGDDPTITIPSVMISEPHGQLIRTAMDTETVNVLLENRETLGNGGVYLIPGKTHINDIITRDNAGVSEIYVATGGSYYSPSSDPTVFGSGDVGVYKTIDGGVNWTQIVLPETPEGHFYTPIDLELGADGTVWMSTTNSIVYATGGGAIFASTDGTNFALKHSITDGERTEIAVSKTDPDLVYAIAVNAPLSIIRTTDNFATTTDLPLPDDASPIISSSDFTNGQGWYDLGIEVDPGNDQNVFVGGINWFKSTNAGTSWNQFSNSYGGQLPNIHPDQHNIVFANSNTILIGNDGGVAYSNDGGATITHRNKNYNVTQFYHMAVAPTTAFSGDYFMAGSQDNGTQQFDNASVGINASYESQGGDGAYCFFDQDGTEQYRISNYIYNRSIELFNYANNDIIQINSEDSDNGDFITQQELDSNQNILFTNYSTSSNFIIKRYKINLFFGSVNKDELTHSLLDNTPTAFKVSPFTTSSTTLLVGLENGKLLKLTNADGTVAWSELTGANIIGSISDIEFGQTENDIFVTVHNYGVTNVWYSDDGGSSWVSKEGDLPDMPVKCILQNPLNPEQLLIGTDLGTWWTQDFSSASPIWYHGTNGMNSVKVTDLELRDDNMVFAATYGRGIFSGQFTAADGTIGFDDLERNTSLSIYPNPSQGNISFSLPSSFSNPEIKIFDLTGRLVYEKNINTNQETYAINLDNLSTGNYIVNVISKNTLFSSKLIME